MHIPRDGEITCLFFLKHDTKLELVVINVLILVVTNKTGLWANLIPDGSELSVLCKASSGFRSHRQHQQRKKNQIDQVSIGTNFKIYLSWEKHVNIQSKPNYTIPNWNDFWHGLMIS